MHRGRIAAFVALVLASTGACVSSSCATRDGRAAGRATSTSVCPPGALDSPSGCACRSDLRLLAGACVAPRLAIEHCGPSALPSWPSDECVPRPACETGRARDLVSGECLARRDVRALATTQGILVSDDDLVGCANARELVAGAPDSRGARRLVCVGRSAVPRRQCPAGSIVEPAGTCVRVIEASLERERERELRVDVARWVHAVIGAEGRAAAPLLCEALARSSVDAPAGRLTVALAFPNNDVTQVVANVRADSAPTVELAATLRPMIEALRSLGGIATQSAVQTVVTLSCRTSKGAQEVAPERPMALPRMDEASP